MDSFHHQDVVLFKVHHVALEEGTALLEVIARNLNLTAGKERIEVLAQDLQVHSLKGLEVIVSVGIQRRALTLHKVIVQFYYLGVHSQHFKLLGNAQGRRRSSRGHAGNRCGLQDRHIPFPDVLRRG